MGNGSNHNNINNKDHMVPDRDRDSNESMENGNSTSSDSSNGSENNQNVANTNNGQQQLIAHNVMSLPIPNISSFPIIKIQQNGLPHLPFVSTTHYPLITNQNIINPPTPNPNAFGSNNNTSEWLQQNAPQISHKKVKMDQNNP